MVVSMFFSIIQCRAVQVLRCVQGERCKCCGVVYVSGLSAAVCARLQLDEEPFAALLGTKVNEGLRFVVRYSGSYHPVMQSELGIK